MRLGALGLVVAFAVAACRPIDGVVMRTAPPGSTATPIVTPVASVTRASVDFVMQEYPVTRGQGPHDVAPRGTEAFGTRRSSRASSDGSIRGSA